MAIVLFHEIETGAVVLVMRYHEGTQTLINEWTKFGLGTISVHYFSQAEDLQYVVSLIRQAKEKQ